MNDRQNTVLATAAAALVLGTIFLCPWRVGTDRELRWSPIYQPPLTYTRTYGPADGQSARIEAEEEARVAYGLLALQGVAIVAAGGIGYRMAAASDHDGPIPPGH